MEQINILIIGGGAREHALAWKLSQAERCGNLYISPGNAGTSKVAINLDLDHHHALELNSSIRENQIGLVLVGPEQPLCDGITDELKRHFGVDFKVIGPSKEAAQLESSKYYAKQFMNKYGIPTADFRYFEKEQFSELKDYLSSAVYPLVLKADGLAAGKGVVICESFDQAISEADAMINDSRFGEAGEKVLVEEFMKGIEMSVFALTDGEDYVLLPEAKDYKRVGEGDVGPNTGGMGAISPVPFASREYMLKVEETIVKPTIDGIRKENLDYKGFVFFGLMDVEGTPKVIEYNVRMGDPETEVVIPRLKSDLLELLLSCAEGSLNEQTVEVDERTVSTVILASGGYPLDYEKGKQISGLESVSSALVFHAGTVAHNGEIQSNGGRVLAISAYGDSMDEALQKSYEAAEVITFDKKYYRKDIGFDLKS